MKYNNLFHGVYVSSRFSAILKEETFKDILVSSSPSSPTNEDEYPNIVAVETLKYLIPINNDIRQEYNKRIQEYMKNLSFEQFQGKYNNRLPLLYFLLTVGLFPSFCQNRRCLSVTEMKKIWKTMFCFSIEINH
jgi:hypothetical protein